MQISDAQIRAMDSLIRGEKTLEAIRPVKTKHALLEKGLVTPQGLVTQEGLKYVSVPTVEVDVITFGSDVTYNHPLPNGKYMTLKFPSGTEMIATFPIVAKNMVYYEGMVNVNGNPLWVRIARSPRFTFSKKLMPLKDTK